MVVRSTSQKKKTVRLSDIMYQDLAYLKMLNHKRQ